MPERNEMRVERIGNATLYLGDSLELLRSGTFGKIGAIVSDPPYGIGYKHSGHTSTNLAGCEIVANTSYIHGDDAPFDPAPWIDAAPSSRAAGNALSDSGLRIVLWGADHFRRSLPDSGTLLAWDKHIGIGGDDSFADCEWAWCGRRVKREIFRYLWKGATKNRTCKLDRLNNSLRRLHVSQKPVELMRWSIEKARPLAGLPVLDPYMGSGTTGVACATFNLPFIGVEIDPGHFETACMRIEDAQRQGRLIA